MTQPATSPKYENPYRSQEVSSEFIELLENLLKLAKEGVGSKIGAHKILVSDIETLISSFIVEQEMTVKARNDERRTAYLKATLGELSQEECMKIPSIRKAILGRMVWALDPITGKLPLNCQDDAGRLNPSSLVPQSVGLESSES